MIEFIDVSKSYANPRKEKGDKKNKTQVSTASEKQAPTENAVNNFNLVIPENQTTVFVGSSGCGKTTLLRMINRMVEPTSGEVRVRGRNVADVNPVELRRSIGYVIQSGGLLPHRKVLDNVTTVPLLNRESKEEAIRRARLALETVELDPSFENRYPGELSGGQQQRVGVARALAADPDILLMDEPFGAVDPIVRRALQQQLIELQARLHKTVVVVTHDVDEAFLLGDNIVVLEKGGKIAQAGTPTEIFAQPANDFVAQFMGTNRADRDLHTAVIGGSRVVVDKQGRPVGRLGADS